MSNGFNQQRLAVCAGMIGAIVAATGSVDAATVPRLATLHSFAGTTSGSHPTAALVQGPDGSFYGTTFGVNKIGATLHCKQCGSVYKIAPDGSFTTLHAFSGPDGANPNGDLIFGQDGNLYGTTAYGGSFGVGTVFRISTSGQLTTLAAFGSTGFNDPAGVAPLSGVIQASDGNFYGTAGLGGAFNLGTVYRMTPDGTLTGLHTFDGSSGDEPLGGLVQGSDGYLYGVTSDQGTQLNPGVPRGNVFRIALDGSFKVLYSFCPSGQNCTDGASPLGALVQGDDGDFYGTTLAGGDTGGGQFLGGGTIFKVTPDGVLTTLHVFGSSTADGSDPVGRLLRASDGNFYGTTEYGGAKGDGAVFRIGADGSYKTVASFAGLNGSVPTGGLVEGNNGILYGTASDGGSHADGVVFKLTGAVR